MNHIRMREVTRRKFAKGMALASALTTLSLLGGIVSVIPASAQISRLGQSEVRLEPGNETSEHDEFGESVAVSGNTMVIGGEGADTALPDTGAAWIFERSGAAWVQTAKLIAGDGNSRDEFGAAVAISEDGNTVAVSAASHSPQTSLGRFNRAGAIYVFQRVKGAWVQQAELISPTIGLSGSFGSFGMAISGNTVVAGDGGNFANLFQGSVDVFMRMNGAWQLATTLTVPNDFFFSPASVAIAGNTVVAGSPDSNPISPDNFDPVGVAYVFDLRADNGVPQAVLSAADPMENVFFGGSLAVDGNRIVVGAQFESAGAAYVFAREEGRWQQEAKLVAADGADGDSFGFAVALSGETVVVGAPEHASTGAAYVYQLRDGQWSPVAELQASDGVSLGFFGGSVWVSDKTLVIGASGQQPQVETDAGYPGGEAYVHRLDH